MSFWYVFIKCNMKERPEAYRSRRFRSPSGCRAKDHDLGRVFAKTGVKMGFQDELKQEPPHISWEKIVKTWKMCTISLQSSDNKQNNSWIWKGSKKLVSKLDSTPNMWMVKESWQPRRKTRSIWSHLRALGVCKMRQVTKCKERQWHHGMGEI